DADAGNGGYLSERDGLGEDWLGVGSHDVRGGSKLEKGFLLSSCEAPTGEISGCGRFGKRFSQ
ncbi:hypothetical protein, partial [Mesorhizobium sp.]|uniref:hypothetical protein n=1 Tax=Mesorhizobium sp. TaxID=1871066 RepID=UPI0025C57EDC